MSTESARFYACSVGEPGKEYAKENLKRIIESKAFILHENTTKGLFDKIIPGDILLLKYDHGFIAYGQVIANRTIAQTENSNGWHLRKDVNEWFFKNNENTEEGVSYHGLGKETTGGGQFGTVKEVTENFGRQKLEEIDNTSPLYLELKLKTTTFNQKTPVQDIINLLEYKKQIILQGPPGTGKTFTAKKIAEEMILKNISEGATKEEQNRIIKDQSKLIQFHPAFSYEDFVRGITAKSNGTSVEYKTENKILAEFAGKALENFLDARKDTSTLSKEIWVREQMTLFAEMVQNTIDRKGKYPLNEKVSIFEIDGDAFRYSGDSWALDNRQRMKFSDIIIAYLNGAKNRQDIKGDPQLSGRARQHASYDFRLLQKFEEFLPKQPQFSKVDIIENKYILIIDEINRANLPAVLGELIYALEYREEAVESMYDIEGERSLTLPPNLYIIGTMNTADRSVGHIDYAIRRRFAFKNILPSREAIHPIAEPLFKQVSELFIKNYNTIDWSNPDPQRSDYLAPDFHPEDVWIGHSYFRSTKTEEKEVRAELDLKLKFEIIPLLKEYVKDGLLMSDVEKQINALNV